MQDEHRGFMSVSHSIQIQIVVNPLYGSASFRSLGFFFMSNSFEDDSLIVGFSSSLEDEFALLYTFQ